MKKAIVMKRMKITGEKAFYSKMGVVTPGCSGGGNPT